jgi:transcriptional regulator of acetoin/glycerol metabolism
MPPLQESEANAIRAALGRCGGHQGRAAAELGISRTTLWRKMSKYGIPRADFSSDRVNVSALK